MSTIEIRKISIVDLQTDAIVNATNEGLLAGGGVCGAIFKAAGFDELQAACNKIGYCPTGSAAITPAFNLHAKYIIHAVGPQWIDGKHNEPKLLYSAYKRSLELAMENGCHSIGFPLISSGIFDYPIVDAWRKAIQACKEFLEKNSNYELSVIFAVLQDDIFQTGEKTLANIAPAFKLASTPKAYTNGLGSKDYLYINSRKENAVYFHKPEEPDGYLSNWYISPFDLDGIHFSSVEQYIMYQKCKIFGDEESADAVLATNDPETQQSIGKNASGYIENVWLGIRQIIVMKGLYAKFTQNEDLRKKLLDTENSVLVECARSDTNWACGISLYDKNHCYADRWKGKNILGFALMEVRRIITENVKVTC